MTTGKKIGSQVNFARKRLQAFNKKIGNAGRSAIAGAAGAAVVLGNIGKSISSRAEDIKDYAFNHKGTQKKNGEVFEVKKSTVIALLVALATVAGVLGALYFYVLRREKELDEYEQLLFSEDFNDDMLDDEPEPTTEPAE